MFIKKTILATMWRLDCTDSSGRPFRIMVEFSREDVLVA